MPIQLDFIRPLLAAGDSNGDIEMLEFTDHDTLSTLRLLLLHDDGEREFAYTSGAEAALKRAAAEAWTVVSTKDDWTTTASRSRAPRSGVRRPA